MLIDTPHTLYKDRRGYVWRIVEVKDYGLSVAPITAARWQGGHFDTRTFQRDGRYYREEGVTDKWDLIEQVTP